MESCTPGLSAESSHSTAGSGLTLLLVLSSERLPRSGSECGARSCRWYRAARRKPFPMADPPRWALQERSVAVSASSVARSTSERALSDDSSKGWRLSKLLVT